MSDTTREKKIEVLSDATILFAGDSGDGMQLTGSQFTLATAYARNDLSTLPDFPAEIRAPAGTTYGVSGFQLHFGSVNIKTPGDEVDLLVAMNPAALKVNLGRLNPEGTIIVNIDAFEKRNLDLAGYDANPLDDDSLQAFRVIRVKLTTLTREALKDFDLGQKEVDRSKNMFALGLALWLYSRPVEPAHEWLEQKFGKKPEILKANLHLLSKGFHYGETTEQFLVQYDVRPAKLPPGKYRAIRGVQALAMGIVAAAEKSGLQIFYGSYPITPASDLLHELSRYKNYNITTFQAEDEIAAVGAALGASFGGTLGITGTSGPGLALKAETMGLGLMTELPMVVVNVQRGGPSTGLPTKTEQSDLLQALYGRNGEAPLPVLATSTPGDCFETAYEACRIAVKYMTPVILLSDGYLANSSEPWLIPDPDDLQPFNAEFITKTNELEGSEAAFLPYRRNEETLARPWAKPGTKGLEHRIGGLEKEDVTGNVSYDPENHQHMTRIRAEKVARVKAEIPPLTVYGDPKGQLLVVGWGSTRGSIESAVDRVRKKGFTVGAVHLRHLNPMAPDLGSILSSFDHGLVPELNDGQLVRILRSDFLLPLHSLCKTAGLPFKASEIVARIEEILS
ncbi:MAG: 2-oxoacid:acceptor oxidoreductase subunit alpha [Rhodothermales bacterium]|nr:2-oxoacid:acceptor oxidoreductase subunit alpha [Rhodothermales bacterium]